MMTTQLDNTLEYYEAAIEDLDCSKLDCSKIEIEHVLNILHARDAVQAAFKQAKHSSDSSILKRLILADAQLRDKAGTITKVIKTEEWEDWRESIHPPAEAWWWRLENIAPHPWDDWDWLWKLLSVAGWTVNLTLLVNIATRFLVGGGVGLFGVGAVALPSILALLQANSQLTKFGQEGFAKLLDKKIPILDRKIPKEYHQEIKLGSTLLMSGFLIGIWSLLPVFSNIYNRNGSDNFDRGNFGSAEQNFQRAISLNSDNVSAHYNLGNLYEERDQIKKAKLQYQIAIGGDLPEAHNNLGRLYIKDKKYPQAAALLTKGLQLAAQPGFQKPEVRYSLFKNLGWVRFKQRRYEEANSNLNIAISISQKPEDKKYIPNPGAAHCLLAQVLEKQKQSNQKALSEWEKCVRLGSRTNPDEDRWLHLARQKLRERKK